MHKAFIIQQKNKVNFNWKRDLCIQETVDERRTWNSQRTTKYSTLKHTVCTIGIKRREELTRFGAS